MRTIRILALALLAGASIALPPAARAGEPEPLRSGTILAAHADTSAYTWLYPWDGCSGAPECLTWLESRCRADLAGRDPALTSSIEAVKDLADGATFRTLEFGTPTAGLDMGRVIVEFWNAGCNNMLDSRAEYHLPCAGTCATFQIPKRARWMTITSKPLNANIDWRLT